MFEDPARFPFLRPFVAHWREIRAELEAVMPMLVAWPERELYQGGWRAYGLHAFPHGAPMPAHLQSCPRTAALIAAHLPHHGATGFSVLDPGAEITPHEGYQGPFLRAHLGLIVPEGDVALRVQLATRKWREGELLVFDDRLEHEAWNRTSGARAVLLLDFDARKMACSEDATVHLDGSGDPGDPGDAHPKRAR